MGISWHWDGHFSCKYHIISHAQFQCAETNIMKVLKIKSLNFVDEHLILIQFDGGICLSVPGNGQIAEIWFCCSISDHETYNALITWLWCKILWKQYRRVTVAAVNVIYFHKHHTLYKFTYMYCVGVYVHILPLLKQLDKGRHASNLTP